jgi:hypothetical protein
MQDGRMTWAMGLDYLKTLAWPTVTLTLAIVFREPIKAVLMRLTAVNTPLGTAEFDAVAEQAVALNPSSPAPAAGSSALPDFSSLYRLASASPAEAVSEAHRGQLGLQALRGQFHGEDERQREISDMVAALDDAHQQHAAALDAITSQQAMNYVRAVELAHAAAGRPMNAPLPARAVSPPASVPEQARPTSR